MNKHQRRLAVFALSASMTPDRGLSPLRMVLHAALGVIMLLPTMCRRRADLLVVWWWIQAYMQAGTSIASKSVKI